MDAARASDEETVMLTKPAAAKSAAEDETKQQLRRAGSETGAPPPATGPADETKHIAMGDDLMVLPAAAPKANPPENDRK